MLLTVGTIKKLYGFSRHSLYAWEKKGLIKSYYTPGGGKKLYSQEELDRLIGIKGEEISWNKKGVSIYARVSTKKQQEYLDNQLERLRNYCKQRGYTVVQEISEIASGINENRLGLAKVINAGKAGKINKIVIEYQDRLARFGYNYLEKLFALCGVDIIVVNGKEDDNQEKELAEDLIAIVSSFAARVYGSRGGRKK